MSLTSQELETLSATLCRIIYAWKNSKTGLFVWAAEDSQVPAILKFMHVFCNKKSSFHY